MIMLRGLESLKGCEAPGQGTRTIECLARPTRSGVHGPKYRLAEVLAGSQGKL